MSVVRKEAMKTYNIIGYDQQEKEYISLKIKASNMNKAIFKINDIPINDLFFNYHGNKKPKFKKNVLDLTLNK